MLKVRQFGRARSNQSPFTRIRHRVPSRGGTQYLNFFGSDWYALEQLIYRCWKIGRRIGRPGSTLAVRIINTNCCGNLLTTKDRFDLTFALILVSDAGRRGSCKESEYGHQGEKRNQCITFLTTRTGAPDADTMRTPLLFTRPYVVVWSTPRVHRPHPQLVASAAAAGCLCHLDW